MSNSTSRPANLHDVARLAGVSYQTVSRVINNHPYVSPDTRERVQKAIDELDYQPNKAARSLITGRSQTLLLVTTDLNFHNPVASMVNTARKHGYHIQLTPLSPSASSQELRAFVNDQKARAIDGLLIMSVNIEFNMDALERLCNGTIPYVQVGGSPGPSTPSVLIDQRYGARQAAQHLISLGHRKIAEITGPPVNFDARSRHESTLTVVAENNLELADVAEGDFTAHGGYRAACQLLDRKAKFTGLICANDETAMGAMYAITERGMRIPHDISIVGFDNRDESSFTNPPLTTVHQDYISLGDLSVDHLVSMLEEPDKPTYQRIIYPQLVIRKSTQALK